MNILVDRSSIKAVSELAGPGLLGRASRRAVHMLWTVVFALSGCGLTYKGDFSRDYREMLDTARKEEAAWLKKKGVTKQQLEAMTAQEVRVKLGRPSMVWHDRDRGACPEKIRTKTVQPGECDGEEWLYNQWSGLPFASGFSQHSVYLREGRVVWALSGPD